MDPDLATYYQQLGPMRVVERQREERARAELAAADRQRATIQQQPSTGSQRVPVARSADIGPAGGYYEGTTATDSPERVRRYGREAHRGPGPEVFGVAGGIQATGLLGGE